MPLTQNTIQDVFENGIIQNSQLAQDFHTALRERYGYEVMASYYKECGKQRTLNLEIKRDQSSAVLFRDKKEVHFHDDDFSAELFEILYGLMDRHGVSHADDEFFRLTLKEKLKNAFSGERAIVSGVTLSCFDSLARWHTLWLCLSEIKAVSDIKKYACRVYCGWDEHIKEERHYVLFKSKDMLNRFLNDGADKRAIPELWEIVCKHDKWHVITAESYKPLFVLESELSNEKKFELLHG